MSLTKTHNRMVEGSTINVLDYIPQSEYAGIRAGTSSYDAGPAIQLAINDAGAIGSGAVEVHIPAGEYIINTPLYITTGGKGSITISGSQQYRTQLTAGSSLSSATKPTMSGGTYTPVLSYVPIMAINVSTGIFLQDLEFEGNNYDVYGLYVNETFYFNLERIRINATNQRPYTFMRVQAAHLNVIQSYLCGQASSPDGSTLFYDCSTITVSNMGMERVGTDRYSCELFQPNNKGGIVFTAPWFETNPTGNKPDLGHFSCGGRNVYMNSPYFSYGTRYTSESSIDLKNSSQTLSTDGLTLTTSAAFSCNIEINDVSNPSLKTVIGSDAKGNTVHGFLDTAKVVNNNSSGDNNVVPNLDASGNGVTLINNGLRVNPKSNASGFLPNNYVMDVSSADGAGPISFFNNANNKLFSDSGFLSLQSNVTLRLKPTDSAGNNVQILTSAGVSTWEKGHLQLGAYHLWVDSTGDLRIKSSAPVSDTDGTIVGTQS